MNTEAALALWALSYAATDVEAQEWAAVALGRGATPSEVDHHVAARQALAVASTQLIGGAQVNRMGQYALENGWEDDDTVVIPCPSCKQSPGLGPVLKFGTRADVPCAECEGQAEVEVSRSDLDWDSDGAA